MEQSDIWSTLKKIPSLTAALQEWNMALGPDSNNSLTFLNPTYEKSLTYPCMSLPKCGCVHKLIPKPSGALESVCCCEPTKCQAKEVDSGNDGKVGFMRATMSR